MQDSHNNNEHTQTANPQYLIMHNSPTDEKEIDLFELALLFYRKKWFIIGVTALFFSLAIVLAYLITPKYEVKTHLLMPKKYQFQKLINATGSDVTAQELFRDFAKTLSYKGNIRSFLLSSGAIDNNLPLDQKHNQLNNLVSNYKVKLINHDKGNSKDNYKDNSMEIELQTLSKTIDINAQKNLDYINYTNNKVLSDFIREQKDLVANNIIQLQNKIDDNIAKVREARKLEIRRLADEQQLNISKLKSKIIGLKQRDARDRQLELQELKDALKIAAALGIASYNAPQEVRNRGIVIDVSANDSELYLKGTTYLKNAIALTKSKEHSIAHDRTLSELKEKLYLLEHNDKIIALENRKDDAPYAKELADKQIELARLQSLTFDAPNVSIYQLDGMPVVGTKPVKPNKTLIIAFGAVAGLMLAIFMVMIQAAVKRRREEEFN